MARYGMDYDRGLFGRDRGWGMDRGRSGGGYDGDFGRRGGLMGGGYSGSGRESPGTGGYFGGEWNRGYARDFDDDPGYRGSTWRDSDWTREGGWNGGSGWNAGFGGRGRNPGSDRGRGYTAHGGRGWGNGYDEELRGRGGGTADDVGERVREGWHDLRRGVRRFFGGGGRGYDRNW